MRYYALFSFIAILACEPGTGMNVPSTTTTVIIQHPADVCANNCGGQPSSGQSPASNTPSQPQPDTYQPSDDQPSTPSPSGSVDSGACKPFKMYVVPTSDATVTLQFWFDGDNKLSRELKVVAPVMISSLSGECAANVFLGSANYQLSYCETTGGRSPFEPLPKSANVMGCWHNKPGVVGDH